MHDIESSPKPDDSPPPYTLMDESGNQGASSSAPPGGPPNTIVVTPPSPVNGSRPISPSQRQVQLFGPTPLQQSQPLLIPYYDPHSPYSLSQADSRTRWRFIGAVLWTVVLPGFRGRSVIARIDPFCGFSRALESLFLECQTDRIFAQRSWNLLKLLLSRTVRIPTIVSGLIGHANGGVGRHRAVISATSRFSWFWVHSLSIFHRYKKSTLFHSSLVISEK
ncbi:hypothetical protein AB1N83_005768 [Pleurotus pulmonarius]